MAKLRAYLPRALFVFGIVFAAVFFLFGLISVTKDLGSALSFIIAGVPIGLAISGLGIIVENSEAQRAAQRRASADVQAMTEAVLGLKSSFERNASASKESSEF